MVLYGVFDFLLVLAKPYVFASLEVPLKSKSDCASLSCLVKNPFSSSAYFDYDAEFIINLTDHCKLPINQNLIKNIQQLIKYLLPVKDLKL